jgi:hypothetical protein
MPTEKNIKMNVSVSKNIDKDILKKLGEAAAGKNFSDRLAGLKEAVKEGFEHTNPARVKMSPDESMLDKEKDIKNFKEKLSQMTESNISKDLYPASEKDIEILKKGISSDEKD